NPPDSRYSLHAPHSQAQARSPLISPALGASHQESHTRQQHPHQPHRSHSRSSVDIANIHDPNTTTNTNNNHNVLSQHQPPAPQRQYSNPSAGLPSSQMNNDR